MRNLIILFLCWLLRVFCDSWHSQPLQTQVAMGSGASNSSHNPLILVKKSSMVISCIWMVLLKAFCMVKSWALEDCPNLYFSSSQTSFAMFNHRIVLAIFSSTALRGHPIITSLTLSHALTSSWLCIALFTVPFTKPSLFYPDNATVTALFHPLNHTPPKILYTIFSPVSVGYR